MASALWLTACGSRSSLDLAIDGSTLDGGGSGGAGDTGGRSAGGQSSGGQNTGEGQTGGRAAGGENSGGQSSGGQETGGQSSGGQATGGQASGGQGSGGSVGCPDGYVDRIGDCVPFLMDLVPSFGGVTPAIQPRVRTYVVTVPTWTWGLGIAPYVAPGVTIDWGGEMLTSGQEWRPPGLAPGEQLEREVFLLAPSSPTTRYDITLIRSGRSFYLKASNTGWGDGFGHQIALAADGRTLAVGAPVEASASLTDQSDDSAPGAGAVYVFVRDGSSWVQQAYLKASNVGTEDLFGYALDLSSDGRVLLVGSPREDSHATGVDGDGLDDSSADAGAAYVFVRRGQNWNEEAYIKASNTGDGDGFGQAVAISADGAILAIGAPSESSSAAGVNGEQSSDASRGSGAVYVLSSAMGGFRQIAYIKASNPGVDDLFGSAVALSSDGQTLVVGAPGEDSASTGIDGDQTSDGATLSGAAYVFSRSGQTFSQSAYVKASDTDNLDMFGSSVAVSDDASTLAIGSYYEGSESSGINGPQDDSAYFGVGAAYVLSRSGPSWIHEAYVKASNPGQAIFAYSLALSASGDVLVVGAPWEDGIGRGIDSPLENDFTSFESGASYRFERTSGSWAQTAYIKAPHGTTQGDLYSKSIAISADGSVVAIGADLENSASTGVDGDPTNNDAFDSGAVYILSE